MSDETQETSTPSESSNDSRLWYYEWLSHYFPEREDGSRDAGNNTIITKEAWHAMVEPYVTYTETDIKLQESLRQIEIYEEAQRRWHAANQYTMFHHPRRNGHFDFLSTIDEWREAFDPINVDLGAIRAKDPEYMEKLKDSILKGLVNVEPEHSAKRYSPAHQAFYVLGSQDL